jgi:hypothetical protein
VVPQKGLTFEQLKLRSCGSRGEGAKVPLPPILETTRATPEQPRLNACLNIAARYPRTFAELVCGDADKFTDILLRRPPSQRAQQPAAMILPKTAAPAPPFQPAGL